tara:strand:+ start:771 stop:1067 length:297 start_codon:yes stop_codon:yes gene_type:complete
MIIEPWKKPKPGDTQQTSFNAYNQTDSLKNILQMALSQVASQSHLLANHCRISQIHMYKSFFQAEKIKRPRTSCGEMPKSAHPDSSIPDVHISVTQSI